MKSPRDPKATLIQSEIHPGLVAYLCPSTGGYWIDGKHYWEWLLKQPGFPKPLPETQGDPVTVEDDSDRPLISPESGHLMRKCRVGSGLDFRIDFDAISRGFWLDHGEYQILESRNLHDELHLICSPEYQVKLIKLQSEKAQSERFDQLLGHEACLKIESFATWLSTYEDQSIPLAYLKKLLDQHTTSS
jgi:Zn-finger nucleic acid-binding protein